MLEAHGRSRAGVTKVKWKLDQVEALVRAMFDHGPRWVDIAAMRLDALADITPSQLQVSSKVLFCDIQVPSPTMRQFSTTGTFLLKDTDIQVLLFCTSRFYC